jgi:hypothetical protein
MQQFEGEAMPKTKTAPSQNAKKPRKAKALPTHEEIALRAYHIFIERGCTPGNEQEDWLRAEQELTEPPKKPRKSKIVPIAA